MPITTKTVVAVPTTYQQNTWFTPFGLGNLNASQTAVRVGRDSKFGIKHTALLAFEGLKIPTDAKITNAFFRMTIFAGFLGSFDMKINFLERDGRWEKSPFRLTEDWTDYPEYDAYFSLITNFFQFVLTAPPTLPPTANFSLRLDSGEGFIQQRYVGQSFVAEVTGKPAIGGVFCRRVGLPVGDVWMEIWTADPLNQNRGLTKLAESAKVDISFLSTTMDNKGFSFVGVNQVELTAGERYVVLMNGDYPFSLLNGLQVGTRPVFFEGEYLDGRLTNFGQGDGFNFWNYGTEAKLFFEPPPIIGTHATWPLPFPVPMPVVTDSPNFKEMIQSWLNTPEAYDADGIIGFRFDEDLQTVAGQLYFLLSVSKAQPQANPFPTLHVTYEVDRGEVGAGPILPSFPMRPQTDEDEETDTDEIELLQVLRSRR